MKKLTLPLTEEDIRGLHAGESVLLSGEILTGRDCAHKRICEMLDRGETLPFPLSGETIYYAGPCPAPQGKACGSCGPTTSARMDDYTPRLLDLGLKIMIGKGKRSREVINSIKRNKAVYLVAVGGAAALIKSRITACEDVAYPDLGCEAVRRLTFDRLPLLVAVDAYGGSIFPE